MGVRWQYDLQTIEGTPLCCLHSVIWGYERNENEVQTNDEGMDCCEGAAINGDLAFLSLSVDLGIVALEVKVDVNSTEVVSMNEECCRLRKEKDVANQKGLVKTCRSYEVYNDCEIPLLGNIFCFAIHKLRVTNNKSSGGDADVDGRKGRREPKEERQQREIGRAGGGYRSRLGLGWREVEDLGYDSDGSSVNIGVDHKCHIPDLPPPSALVLDDSYNLHQPSQSLSAASGLPPPLTLFCPSSHPRLHHLQNSYIVLNFRTYLNSHSPFWTFYLLPPDLPYYTSTSSDCQGQL
ncbi:uncharacterized protein EI90DRAFT_3022659 [Cantharellus anzutake]|uniref:uncharacterized protein n=1 Tax=Cantharellus anzutake TaxID=1750568 RepID=UPI001908ACF1|nr:uncharacterized protein EI90DRAFT_3022659 [Cantharellus anzutake]KAF8313522.1 hypothetical protein EI90DRAFT_3022659 [Cantharellus anzutake]